MMSRRPGTAPAAPCGCGRTDVVRMLRRALGHLERGRSAQAHGVLAQLQQACADAPDGEAAVARAAVRVVSVSLRPSPLA